MLAASEIPIPTRLHGEYIYFYEEDHYWYYEVIISLQVPSLGLKRFSVVTHEKLLRTYSPEAIMTEAYFKLFKQIEEEYLELMLAGASAS